MLSCARGSACGAMMRAGGSSRMRPRTCRHVARLPLHHPHSQGLQAVPRQLHCGSPCELWPRPSSDQRSRPVAGPAEQHCCTIEGRSQPVSTAERTTGAAWASIWVPVDSSCVRLVCWPVVSGVQSSEQERGQATRGSRDHPVVPRCTQLPRAGPAAAAPPAPPAARHRDKCVAATHVHRPLSWVLGRRLQPAGVACGCQASPQVHALGSGTFWWVRGIATGSCAVFSCAMARAGSLVPAMCMAEHVCSRTLPRDRQPLPGRRRQQPPATRYGGYDLVTPDAFEGARLLGCCVRVCSSTRSRAIYFCTGLQTVALPPPRE